MNYKEQLKQSQGQSRNFIDLPLTAVYKIGEHDGSAAFIRYDKETKENIALLESIEGVMIGGAMKLFAFDDGLGSKGGNYFSDYYFDKNTVKILKPGERVEIVYKGDLEGATNWIASNTTSRVPKKRWCIFLFTSSGLVEVQTNMTIYFDQVKRLKQEQKNPDIFLDNVIRLEAKEYSGEDNISKKALSILGKFIKKNPPKYADITLGDTIDPELGEQLIDVSQTFVEWKKQKMNQIDGLKENPNIEKPQVNEPEPETDDLPF